MSKATLLIADPHTLRRRALQHQCEVIGGVTVLEAATLGEAYVMTEAHLPSCVAVAAEYAELREFEALSDILSMIDARTVIIGDGRQAGISLGPAMERIIAVLTEGVATASPEKARPVPASSVKERSTSDDTASSVILIGASTGGISALEMVLGAFPKDCPPTLVVQHIRPGFADSLIRRLDQRLAPTVVPAEDGMPLRRGVVYLAASQDRHLALTYKGGLRTRLVAGPPVSGHRPSVDVLFSEAAAMAEMLELRAALLTGMGADGAQGMCILRRAGATTIAQDRESSVVWGMPRVAVEMGGASEVLPLGLIGAALVGRNALQSRQVR